jgi:hypothetical protein
MAEGLEAVGRKAPAGPALPPSQPRPQGVWE